MRKLKQLRAISYAYAKKNEAERQAEIEKIGVPFIYKYQNIYKTSYGFLNAVKRGKLEALYLNAKSLIEAELKSLEDNYKTYFSNGWLLTYDAKIVKFNTILAGLNYEFSQYKRFN